MLFSQRRSRPVGLISTYAVWITRPTADAFEDPKTLGWVVFAYFAILLLVYGVRCGSSTPPKT